MIERRSLEIQERYRCDWVEAWARAAAEQDIVDEFGQSEDRARIRPRIGRARCAPGRVAFSEQIGLAVPPQPGVVAPGRTTLSAALPPAVMRSAERTEVDPAAAELVARARRGGAPLDDKLRPLLEAALGARLGDVRVHTDDDADAAARALGARAFAIGDDVFFRDGAYDPQRRDGQRLIAHEVAHTVQARGASAPSGEATTVSQPDDAPEREADAFADAFVHGIGLYSNEPAASNAARTRRDRERPSAPTGFGQLARGAREIADPAAREVAADPFDFTFARVGEHAPPTARGSQPLAHEFPRVAMQSSGSAPVIQLASIRAYNDSVPLHDPSRLTDGEIEATDEYIAYMAMPRPIPMRPILPEEARLACRLLLRAMREGRPTVSGCYVYRPEVLHEELEHWLAIARSRLATTATAEGAVGTQHWVAASATDVTAPATAASDFTRWMLGGGTQPNPTTGRLNCWEMVLFSAFRAGHLGETRMRDIYTRSVAAMTTGGDMAFPRTLETLLRSSDEHTYNPADPDSPRPLRGDLIIFQEAANHVALATGNRVHGEIEIVSHWPPPDGSYNVKITTIEALLARMPGVSVAKFWSPIW